MEHTPGPWWYDKRTESIGCASGWLGRVTPTQKAEPPFGNPDADGLLMATSPMLLAACEAALDALDEYTSWQEAARVKLRAAISAAKG